MNDTMSNIYLYTRYERLWHWFQMVLIAILLVTGFEVKGVYTLLGFQTAVKVHNVTGLTWLISFFFFVFCTGGGLLCSKCTQKDLVI